MLKFKYKEMYQARNVSSNVRNFCRSMLVRPQKQFFLQLLGFEFESQTCGVSQSDSIQ